jgi:hypothetical protein
MFGQGSPSPTTSSQLCGGVALPPFFLPCLDRSLPIDGHSGTCLPGMPNIYARRWHSRSDGLHLSGVPNMRGGRSVAHGQMRKREYETGLSKYNSHGRPPSFFPISAPYFPIADTRIRRSRGNLRPTTDTQIFRCCRSTLLKSVAMKAGTTENTP